MSNSMNNAIAHLIDCCRLEIVDLKDEIQALSQVLQDEEAYGDNPEKCNKIRNGIAELEKDIETRDNVLTAISYLTYNKVNTLELTWEDRT